MGETRAIRDTCGQRTLKGEGEAEADFQRLHNLFVKMALVGRTILSEFKEHKVGS